MKKWIVVAALIVASAIASGCKKASPTAIAPNSQTPVSAVASQPKVAIPKDWRPASDSLVKFVQQQNRNLSPETVHTISRAMEFYSEHYGIHVSLLAGLVSRESSFYPSATSSSGAQGLGQIMPVLANDLELNNAYDIHENLEGTSRWLRKLYDVWVRDGVDRDEAITWALASYKQGLTRTRDSGITRKTADYINDIYTIAARVPSS
ncbi:MAG: transglycosylase SLT domain-containing protein [Cyanobacteria bacterium P01_F01_bin.33]